MKHSIKVLIIFIILIIIGYFSYKMNEHFGLGDPTPTPTPTILPINTLITLTPSLSEQILANEFNEDTISYLYDTYMADYNIETLAPYFKNTPLENDYKTLINKKKISDASIKSDILSYNTSIDSYAKKIANAQRELDQLNKSMLAMKR
jgi:hypothetical protein